MMFFRSIQNFLRRRRKTSHSEIEPEEIFQDSRNHPDLEVDGFEGRLERPIERRTVRVTGIFFLVIVGIFSIRLFGLQIVHGEYYQDLANANRLEQTTVFSNRGIVYDRNGDELIWNKKSDKNWGYTERVYIGKSGFSHLLGYVSYPQADDKGIFYRKEYVGRMGVEKVFNKRLSGSNGTKIVEYNATGDVVSENKVVAPKSGKDLTLSIDSRVQNKLHKLLARVMKDHNYARGGAGVIIDVDNGELLAIASVPTFDSSVMADGNNAELIEKYNTNPKSVFLNRATAGLFSPGSVVKPFIALGALREGVVEPDTIIVSTGKIVIENPYNPGHPYVFRDWKAHGPIAMRQAIAESSDEYFYQVGGGYKDQKGIGIDGINKYMRMFGFGSATGFVFPEEEGVVPNPEWKERVFGQPWYLGDTYHTAIGQYGTLVTPLQMAVAAAAIANNGKLLVPKILKGAKAEYKKLPFTDAQFDVIHDGMRLSVLEGTAHNIDPVGYKLAAKTGTAEVGAEKYYENSWVIGYFPYEDPQYAFAVAMGKGPGSNYIGGVYVMRQLFEWMQLNTPEYLH